jgi:hypothetical protein
LASSVARVSPEVYSICGLAFIILSNQIRSDFSWYRDCVYALQQGHLETVLCLVSNSEGSIRCQYKYAEHEKWRGPFQLTPLSDDISLASENTYNGEILRNPDTRNSVAFISDNKTFLVGQRNYLEGIQRIWHFLSTTLPEKKR